MAYKSRQCSEKDGLSGSRLLLPRRRVITMNKREKDKKTKEMNAKKLFGGIEGTVGNEINNIDLVMASNTQATQEHNNNNYELCVDSYNISKKGEFKKPNIDIENYVEGDRWDYSNECNKWEGGGLRNNYDAKQNRMSDNYICNDRIKNDELANILLSLNKKNTLKNSCNDKEHNNGEGENKGDTNDQFDANMI